MPRTVDAATITELTASKVSPRFWLQIELADGILLNYWTGEKDISWNSKTWLANGFFKNLSQLRESSQGNSEGFEIDLAGEPSALIALALAGNFQRYRPANVYFGFVSDANVVVDTPIVFSGRLETMKLIDGTDQATLKLRYTSLLSILEQPTDRRFNQQSQQIDYPTDLGFQYVEQMLKWDGYWGVRNPHKKGQRQKKKDPQVRPPRGKISRR